MSLSLISLVSENYLLFVLPAGAAVIGLGIGKLLREPELKQGQRQKLSVKTQDFAILQAGGTVRGRKTTIASKDTHEPIEELLEICVPSGMPQDQREDSIRRAAAA
jgi:hypothetical protein